MGPNTTERRPLFIIFITVFIYLLGFGIVIPIIPLLSTQLGATAFQSGLLLSAYSLMQFIFAPFWGRLSDRYGRRPILLICLVGEVLSYLLFAQARTLEWLFVARLLSGFFGASISTASAYISDITPDNERTKGMALIGAAFGLGFLFGPAIGGGLTVWAEKMSDNSHFQTSFSSYWVAALCLLTFIFAYFNLPETNLKKSTLHHTGRWNLWNRYFRTPLVGPLILVFFISSFAMSSMEATLVLYMKDIFGWGLKEVSFGFAYVGVMMVFTQGFLVRKLLPKLGEKYVLRIGLFFMFLAFSGIAVSTQLMHLAVTQTLLAVGVGLTNPSIMGSISLLINQEEQGAALGTTQGMSSLGRILGPLLGGFAYSQFHKVAPFVISATLVAVSLSIIFSLFSTMPNSAKTGTQNE